jgi:hypothetical protein
MMHLVGKRCTFRSKAGDKGLHGVKVSSFKDKLQLEVSTSAEIEQFAGQQKPSTPPARGQTPPPAATGQHTITSLMALYNACYAEVWATATDDEKQNADYLKNIATTLFIAAKQEGIRV